MPWSLSVLETWGPKPMTMESFAKELKDVFGALWRGFCPLTDKGKKITRSANVL